MSKPITHIAIGVVTDRNDKLLVALRPKHLEMGGQWEFPGGKIEKNETIKQGLIRECQEEVGITPVSARPLITIPCDLPDRLLILHAWWVDWFSGEPHGHEGQPIKWVSIEELKQLDMLSRNVAIVNAVCLPDRYWITPEPDDIKAFKQLVEEQLNAGIKLIRLRAKELSSKKYQQLAKDINLLCQTYDTQLIIHSDIGLVNKINAAGIHLTTAELMKLTKKPKIDDKWCAASCHNAKEIKQAMSLGIDFITLSPIKKTTSHPKAKPTGWKGAAKLIDKCTLPVYLLGGMQINDIPKAQAIGAQGVAGISMV